MKLNPPSFALPFADSPLTGSPLQVLGVFTMEEIWKDIPNYDGLYQVSSLGRFKRITRCIVEKSGKRKVIKGRIIKTHEYTNGYIRVALCINGIEKQYIAHRIVAITFLPQNSYENIEVNHKNEIKSDNRVENLEWVTHKYNCSYGTRNKRAKEHSDFRGEKNPMFGKIGCKNKNSIKIQQLDLEGNYIRTFDSAACVERELGYNSSCVIGVSRGRCKQAYGYKWKQLTKTN